MSVPDIPSTEPDLVFAGQTLQWTKSLPDFPADQYSLKYYLSGPSSINLTSSAYNVTDHLISATSATTASWAYGIYSWQAYAEKGADETLEKWLVGSGYLTVKTASGKSFAKTMLDAIEAILTNSATSKDLDIVSKSIGTVSLSRDRDKLIKYRDKFRAEYQSELDRENISQGKAGSGKIRVKFI